MTNPGALQGASMHNQSWAAPQPPTLYCAHCGATPAAAVDIRGHRGFIVFMQFLRMSGPFCRDCGLATYRRMTLESVWLGWWGPMSMFINPLTMLLNLFAYNSIANLAPPVPGMPGRPLDPGKPLFQRPAALGFLLPIAAVTLILIAIVISSVNPT